MNTLNIIKKNIKELSDDELFELYAYIGNMVNQDTYRRNTLENEEKLLKHKFKNLPLKVEFKPDFDTDVESFMFVGDNKGHIATFKNALSYTTRFDTPIKILEKGIVVNDFLTIEVCNSLMNIFLQVAEVKKTGNIIEDFSELMHTWGGQALSFKMSRSNVMIPHESETPAEIAFYKLERKHQAFKRFAEELGTFFKQIFNTNKLNVSLSLRYLVANMGGNPIHIDAWEDSILKDKIIYTNQQFSLFLHANNKEKFVVFNTDGTQVIQQGTGSLMGFNPTQKHHHPTGHGSWIMIIEAIIQNEL